MSDGSYYLIFDVKETFIQNDTLEIQVGLSESTKCSVKIIKK